MADYFSQAVVSPELPLRDIHFRIFDLLRGNEEGKVEDPEEVAILRDHFGALMEEGEVREDYSPGALSFYKQEDGRYYCYCEEGYFDDSVLRYLQWVLTTLDEAEFPCISIEVAYTCSKMRADGFGGSAFLVTRDDTHAVHTGTWLALAQKGQDPEALLEALAARAERTEDAGRVVVDLAVLKTLCETFGLKLEPA